MNVLGIDFTFFAVSDMQKSLAFYRDLLGIPLTRLILKETSRHPNLKDWACASSQSAF